VTTSINISTNMNINTSTNTPINMKKKNIVINTSIRMHMNIVILTAMRGKKEYDNNAVGSKVTYSYGKPYIF
jgi:hypothetical protein